MAEINPSNLIETGSNAIPNGQVAIAMRRSMENKNLLTGKGSLYAGTGRTYPSQDSVGNTYNTAVTDAVEAPTQSGQVLVSNLDSGGPDTGLKWRNAAPNADNVKSLINGRSISYIFETNGTTVKNATNATKLTSGTVGSSTTPVYFNNGQPTACGGSLAVNAATATSATNLTSFGGTVNPTGRGNSTSAGGYSTAIGDNTVASKQYDTAYGANSSASGGSSVALGSNSVAAGAGSVALGDGAKSSGDNSISIGAAVSSGDESIVLGYSSVASGDETLAIGTGAQATQQQCIALGPGAKATGLLASAIGTGAKAEGTSSIALVGTASGNASISIGLVSKALGVNSISVGGSTTASGVNSVVLGQTATAGGNGGVALGPNATAGGNGGVALGPNTTAGANSSTAIGVGATVSTSDTNTMQLGDSSFLSTLRCRVNLTVTSDERDKTDITPIVNSLEFINSLNPITYVTNERVKYISDEDKNSEDYRKYGMCEYDKEAHARGDKKGTRRRSGLLAQEVIGVMQDVYGTDNYANIVNDNLYDLPNKPENIENQYTLAYSNLIPFLIGAIKEQQVQIEELKKEITSLKKEN